MKLPATLRAAELFHEDPIEIALGKYWKTAEGRQTRQIMRRAPGPVIEPEQEPLEKSPIVQQLELPAMKMADAKADEIRIHNPDLTREQCFVQALRANPALRQQIKKEQRALVQRLTH